MYHLFRSRVGIGQEWLHSVPFAISVIISQKNGWEVSREKNKNLAKSLMQSLLSFIRYALEIFSVGDKNIFCICGI